MTSLYPFFADKWRMAQTVGAVVYSTYTIVSLTVIQCELEECLRNLQQGGSILDWHIDPNLKKIYYVGGEIGNSYDTHLVVRGEEDGRVAMNLIPTSLSQKVYITPPPRRKGS